MAEYISKETGSRAMSCIRSNDTKPKKAMCITVHTDGFRYFLRSQKLQGKSNANRIDNSSLDLARIPAQEIEDAVETGIRKQFVSRNHIGVAELVPENIKKYKRSNC